MKTSTFSKGGIHPPQSKLTAGIPVTDIGLPDEVTVMLSQHIGAPASCLVGKGDHVTRGQLIARGAGAVSANIHAPISGTITKIEKIKGAGGYPADAMTIKADEADTAADTAARAAEGDNRRPDHEVDALTPSEIIAIIDNAGIVGLGGATFPTKVKLTPPPGSHAEILIVNGAECEPYLTCDHALMLSRPREIMAGVRLLMKAAGVSQAAIGIEANKPDAIDALRLYAGDGITIRPLTVKYPQGGEKQLIKAITGREVQSGALPISTGAIVQNVATAYAVWEAVVLGKPLIERIVTVTGPGLAGGNYRVPMGTTIERLLETVGAADSIRDGSKLILGGPMMGRAISNPKAPVTKGVSGILILDGDDARRDTPQPCIRCGACVEACPMGLEPYLLATLSRRGMYDATESRHIMDCIECGSCSYSCPAARPILDYIRLGKSVTGANIRRRRASATR